MPFPGHQYVPLRSGPSPSCCYLDSKIFGKLVNDLNVCYIHSSLRPEHHFGSQRGNEHENGLCIILISWEFYLCLVF